MIVSCKLTLAKKSPSKKWTSDWKKKDFREVQLKDILKKWPEASKEKVVERDERSSKAQRMCAEHGQTSRDTLIFFPPHSLRVL